jgi:predicted O-methyltransferase YrrM
MKLNRVRPPNPVTKSIALLRCEDRVTDRIRIKIDGLLGHLSPGYNPLPLVKPCELENAVANLLRTPRPILDSPKSELASLERGIAARRAELEARGAPFNFSHNATATLGRLCYALCKATQPRLVVETGVAYGITSAYTLAALSSNGEGVLVSVDLAPLTLNGASFVGYLVPPELRARWELHTGSARRILPGVLERTSPIDIFIHDSLHTYAHMSWEFGLALSALRPGGLLISDDIGGNTAFERVTRDPRAADWFATSQPEKTALAGVVRKKLET